MKINPSKILLLLTIHQSLKEIGKKNGDAIKATWSLDECTDRYREGQMGQKHYKLRGV